MRSWMKKAAGLPAVPALSDVSPDHICTIIYTSGTTGNPKGVELSHRNIVSDCRGANDMWYADGLDGAGGLGGLTQQTTLAFLPWAHVFGMTCELHQFTATGKSIKSVTTLLLAKEAPNVDFWRWTYLCFIFLFFLFFYYY
jgi:long-chain acyl-CoA synthetase